jgi:hypothetical protein
VRTVIFIALLCLAAAALGWFFRGAEDYKHFETHLEAADSLQARLDTMEQTLIVARRNLAASEKASLTAQLEHERVLAVLDVQNTELVKQLNAHIELPDTVKRLISQLETNHEQEKAVWISENSLLRAQLQTEKDVRLADEVQLDSTRAENALLRAAIAAKPNQVVLAKPGFWRTTTYILGGTTLILAASRIK